MNEVSSTNSADPARGLLSLQFNCPRGGVAAFCRRHRIRRLSLFGSVLTEQFRPESDVDVLVEFEPDAQVGLIGFAGMEIELSELMGRRVDLNTPGSLSPHFREEVFRTSRTLYDTGVESVVHRQSAGL